MNADHAVSSYESLSPTALPVSNGRFAMWLFLSTEVMFFAALLSAYLVFRLAVAPGSWPTVQDVGVQRWAGAVNTAILLLSSATLTWSIRSCRKGNAAGARRWLGATCLLAVIFLSIKGGEYYDKWRHGIFNWGGKPLLHEKADLQYLAHVKSALRTQLGASGAPPADGSSPSPAPNPPGPPAGTSLLWGGLVEWPGQQVGQGDDPQQRQQALNNTALLIYPHRSLGGPELLESEWAMLSQMMRQSEREQVADGERLIALQQQLAAEPGEGRNELSRLDAAAREEWTAEASAISQRLSQRKVALGPLSDRVALLDQTRDQWREGIARSQTVRLPQVIPHGQTWSSLYLLFSGCHGLHVIGGLIALLCCWPGRNLKGSVAALSNLRLYWYFVDLVWLGILALFYW